MKGASWSPSPTPVAQLITVVSFQSVNLEASIDKVWILDGNSSEEKVVDICILDGKEYAKGQSIPTGDPCKICKCVEGFNGNFNIHSTKIKYLYYVIIPMFKVWTALVATPLTVWLTTASVAFPFTPTMFAVQQATNVVCLTKYCFMGFR